MADYIDREAIYRKVCRGCTRHGDEIGICYLEEPCEELQAEFVSAPAADVAPVRHGRWVFTAEKCYPEPGYKCSACRSANWRSPDVPKSFRYCPHCGAKMDEKEMEE